MTRVPLTHQEPGSPFKGLCWATIITVLAVLIAFPLAVLIGAANG